MMTRSKKTRTGVVKDRNFTAKEVSNSCFFSDLPTLILLNVFFRLPVKDVTRCKSVSTAWNKLISEPKFSENYAKNSPFTSLFRCMDPRDIDHLPNVSYLLEITENGDCIRTPFNPKLPGWLRESFSLLFIGSCNGFVCMKVHKPGVEVIYITNPIMGDPIALPERERDERGISVALYNFGFCPSMKKYKVLRIAFRCIMDMNAEACEIFTVGDDDMWRPLPNSFTALEFFSVCVVVNEALHWLPEDNDLGLVSTFHMGEEKFGQISLPPSLLPVSERVKLAVFGNQLGLVDFSDYCSDLSKISLWKMKEYSVVESWNKVSILPSWFPPAPRSGDLVSVIELKNGDMLLTFKNDGFISCNIEQKKCSQLEIDRRGRRNYRSVLTFTPNFWSPAELIMKGQGNTVNVQSK